MDDGCAELFSSKEKEQPPDGWTDDGQTEPTAAGMYI